MRMIKVSPKNKGRTRTLKVGDVTFRTCDKTIDLNEDWLYRQQMIELATEHKVAIVELRSGEFRACAGTISIAVNPATTDDLLRVYAHECAHIGFNHSRSVFTRHRMEFETETYSAAYLRSQQIAVDPKWVADGQRYVAYIIQMAIDRRIKRFDADAWHFADPAQLHETRQKAFIGFTPELYDGSKDNGYREAMAALEQKTNGVKSKVQVFKGVSKVESVTTISIADITIDPSFQMRASVSQDTVDDYSDTVTGTEAEWPFSTPCSVYRVSGQLLLTDGFHRVAAMQQAGRDAIRATVVDGSRSDALISALSSNHSHGLRRNNADKRRCVEAALADDLLSSMSDRELSTLCGVSHPFVGQIRSELETVTTSEVVGADGKAYPTSNVAKAKRVEIAKAIESTPEQSNVKIAESVGVSDKTVASVRAEISRPKQVTPEPEPEVSTLDPYDAIEAVWNSVPDDERASLRDRIACMMGIAPVSTGSQALFPDVAAEQKTVGRKKSTEAEFEAFWQAYPRRTEKGNARKAFEKAFTNLREQFSIADVIEKIMSGVDAYAKNADPDYLCHPATWLNGCRWDDEPASIGKAKKKSHSDFGKYDEATADEPW